MMRKKVFFSAHEISPSLGSECSSGWNISLGLSYYHDLTVVYAQTNQFGTENYEEQVNNYFKESGVKPRAIYIAVPQPPISRIIANINKYISSSKSSTGNSFLFFLAYKFWQKNVYKRFKAESRINKFDIIHHFNCLSFREPGYFFKSDLPFFWGPVSGLDKIPLPFLFGFPFPMVLSCLIRNFLNDFQFFTSIRLKKAIRKASKIYAVTKVDFLKFHSLNSNTINLLDVGSIKIDNQEVRSLNLSNEKLRCIWVGRLDKLKALDILIESIYQSEKLKKNVEVTIVGDGINRDQLIRLVNKYQLTNIFFIGSVDKKTVAALMMKSHILVHTSIKEAASAVILEGLSSGLPIVCHDAFGMSHAINASCGIKVNFANKSKSITGFRNALEDFLDNPLLVSKLSEGSYTRSKELSWSGIVQCISNDYFTIC